MTAPLIYHQCETMLSPMKMSGAKYMTFEDSDHGRSARAKRAESPSPVSEDSATRQELLRSLDVPPGQLANFSRSNDVADATAYAMATAAEVTRRNGLDMSQGIELHVTEGQLLGSDPRPVLTEEAAEYPPHDSPAWWARVEYLLKRPLTDPEVLAGRRYARGNCSPRSFAHSVCLATGETTITSPYLPTAEEVAELTAYRLAEEDMLEEVTTDEPVSVVLDPPAPLENIELNLVIDPPTTGKPDHVERDTEPVQSLRGAKLAGRGRRKIIRRKPS